MVHAHALTWRSKPLRAMLGGSMKEATECRVFWEDVDEQTFVRFMQWAYTDEYTTAEPDILLDASNIQLAASSASTTKTFQNEEKALLSVQERTVAVPAQNKVYRNQAYNCESHGGIRVRTRCCTKCNESFSANSCANCNQTLDIFCAKCRPVPKGTTMVNAFTTSTLWATSDSAFKPRQNTEACEDYSKVFFCHANLYILADKYDITALGALSMHKLYTTLKTFKLYPSRMHDILSLVALVFDNTRTEDKLRAMLVHYCTCIVENLAKCETFQPTLQDFPEFMSALMAKMTERLD